MRFSFSTSYFLSINLGLEEIYIIELNVNKSVFKACCDKEENKIFCFFSLLSNFDTNKLLISLFAFVAV